MPWCAFRTATARPASRRAGRRLVDAAGRPDQPSLDQEHHRQSPTAAGSTSPSARTATSPRTASRPRKAAPRSGRSTRDRRASRLRLGPAQPERHGVAAGRRGALWTVGQRARRARQRPRARLPDLGAATARSTAGPTATTASTSTSASSRSGPTWSPARSRPTTRSARTRRRSASPTPTAARLPAPFRERRVHRPARLVEPQAAQRLQGDLRAVRATAGRPASRSTC